jgi:predicted metal-dependent hydrolase
MTLISIDYGTSRITADIRRSARATLDITVEPSGDVRITAPFEADLDDVRRRLRARARWVLAQQRYFEQFRPRTPERRWVPGETHRYLGRQYRLRIADSAASTPGVRRTRDFLSIDGVDYDDSARIERTMQEWYRDRAEEVILSRLPDCILRFDPPLVPTAIAIRRMSSRWASMSSQGRLTVNPDLVRAPADAIDYVLTHELVHLAIPDHSATFFELLQSVMPDFARRKHRLEKTLA